LSLKNTPVPLNTAAVAAAEAEAAVPPVCDSLCSSIDSRRARSQSKRKHSLLLKKSALEKRILENSINTHLRVCCLPENSATKIEKTN